MALCHCKVRMQPLNCVIRLPGKWRGSRIYQRPGRVKMSSILQPNILFHNVNLDLSIWNHKIFQWSKHAVNFLIINTAMITDSSFYSEQYCQKRLRNSCLDRYRLLRLYRAFGGTVLMGSVSVLLIQLVWCIRGWTRKSEYYIPDGGRVTTTAVIPFSIEKVSSAKFRESFLYNDINMWHCLWH